MAVAAVASACGVPDHGPPVTITQVPYHLMQPEPSVTATPSPGGTARPFVYLVRDQVLVPVQASVRQLSDPAAAVMDVLAQLADGPSEQDRNAGLSTALGPDTAVHLAGLEDGVARIDIVAGDQIPSPSRVPLAVAQVVLSVTSVPGVGSVLMTRDGSPVELPLPGGALTGSPVRAQDYVPLVGPTAPATTTARPGSAGTPARG